MNKSFVVPAFRRNNNDPLKPVPRTCCKQTLETTSQNGNPTRKRGASMLLILGGIIAIRQKPVLRTCCNQTLETTSPNGNPTRKRGASMLLMISRLRRRVTNKTTASQPKATISAFSLALSINIDHRWSPRPQRLQSSASHSPQSFCSLFERLNSEPRVIFPCSLPEAIWNLLFRWD